MATALNKLKLSTGVIAQKVRDSYGGYDFDVRVRGKLYSKANLEALGITWEDYILPEPPVGSMFYFIGNGGAPIVAIRTGEYDYESTGTSSGHSWAGLQDRFEFTQYEILAPVHKTVDEAFSLLWSNLVPVFPDQETMFASAKVLSNVKKEYENK